MKKEQLFTLWFVLFAFLACGTSIDSLPSQEQAQAAMQTAEALGQQASALATEAAPTLAALATQAAAMATQVGPTLEAGAVELATRAANAQATLQAAGITADYLRQKAASLTPDANGNVTLVVTQAEINLVVQAQQQEAGSSGVQNTQVRLTNGAISISGRVTQPVEGNIILNLQPVVTNGQLQFEVLSAALNDQALPDLILNQLESSLNTSLVGAVNGMPGNVELKSITITEGEMAITAGQE